MNEKINKRFEKSETLIQKHQSEIPKKQLINKGKKPNHERCENIIMKFIILNYFV